MAINSPRTIQQELARLPSECSQSRIDFLDAAKDAGALKRELMRRDERISQLQRSLEQANSAPSKSSWQAVNCPEDNDKKKLREAVDQLQTICAALEGQNKMLSDRLGDQESFVEHRIQRCSERMRRPRSRFKRSERAWRPGPLEIPHGVILPKSYCAGVLFFTPSLQLVRP